MSNRGYVRGGRATTLNNLYIKGLDPRVTEDILRARFEEYGTITSLMIRRDIAGEPTGVAFVAFVDNSSATEAIKGTHCKPLLLEDGVSTRPIFVSFFQPKSVREMYVIDGKKYQRPVSTRMPFSLGAPWEPQHRPYYPHQVPQLRPRPQQVPLPLEDLHQQPQYRPYYPHRQLHPNSQQVPLPSVPSIPIPPHLQQAQQAQHHSYYPHQVPQLHPNSQQVPLPSVPIPVPPHEDLYHHHQPQPSHPQPPSQPYIYAALPIRLEESTPSLQTPPTPYFLSSYPPLYFIPLAPSPSPSPPVPSSSTPPYSSQSASIQSLPPHSLTSHLVGQYPLPSPQSLTSPIGPNPPPLYALPIQLLPHSPLTPSPLPPQPLTSPISTYPPYYALPIQLLPHSLPTSTPPPPPPPSGDRMPTQPHPYFSSPLAGPYPQLLPYFPSYLQYPSPSTPHLEPTNQPHLSSNQPFFATLSPSNADQPPTTSHTDNEEEQGHNPQEDHLASPYEQSQEDPPPPQEKPSWWDTVLNTPPSYTKPRTDIRTRTTMKRRDDYDSSLSDITTRIDVMLHLTDTNEVNPWKNQYLKNLQKYLTDLAEVTEQEEVVLDEENLTDIVHVTTTSSGTYQQEVVLDKYLTDLVDVTSQLQQVVFEETVYKD